MRARRTVTIGIIGVFSTLALFGFERLNYEFYTSSIAARSGLGIESIIYDSLGVGGDMVAKTSTLPSCFSPNPAAVRALRATDYDPAMFSCEHTDIVIDANPVEACDPISHGMDYGSYSSRTLPFLPITTIDIFWLATTKENVDRSVDLIEQLSLKSRQERLDSKYNFIGSDRFITADSILVSSMACNEYGIIMVNMK